jgi:hypothetical protein
MCPFSQSVGTTGAVAIPDAAPATATSPGQDGVMNKTQAAALAAATSSLPVVPATEIALVDTVTKSILAVNWSKIPDRSFAMTVNYAVECTDGTNTQIQSGLVNGNLARASNGTYASSQTAAATSNTVTSGGMTITFSWDTTTDPNNPVFRVNANSSLTPTILEITFYVAYATHPEALSVAP